MNKIIYNLVFNKRKKLTMQGTALVYVRATLGNKQKYFSTNIYLRPEQWDSKKQLIMNHPNAEALNQMLHEYIAFIEKKELILWKTGKEITLEAVEQSLTIKNESSFISFFTSEIDNSSLKESTKKNHRSTLQLLTLFKPVVRFSDLNYEMINSFDLFLQSRGYHINTIAKHMKQLKRYVNIAINKEFLDYSQYAFRKYKIRSVENHHSYLAPEELYLLEKLVLNPKESRLQKTLDAFLFCCYTGLRYSDFVSLKSDNLMLIDNKPWLIYRSVKTRIEVRLPLYLLFGGKSMNILHKYQNNINSFFQLRDNSNINKDLLRISRITGLSKHISFHTARHTNATLLIYNGMNITSVQKILGHKSVKTTQIYTTIMDMTLIRDLEKIHKGSVI